MLASIGPRSKEVRAQQLRLELMDVLDRLSRLADGARGDVSVRLAGHARHIRETFGPFGSITPEAKIEISRHMAARAREAFEQDMAQCYAYFILSALYEAAGLGGDDADFVKALCAKQVLAALEADRSHEPAP